MHSVQHIVTNKLSPICDEFIGQYNKSASLTGLDSVGQVPSFNSWIDVSLMIVNFAKHRGFQVVDIYLVGGVLRRRTVKPDKDMDSVIVVGSGQSIRDLVKLRFYISSWLNELNIDSWYHYKLIDVCELKRMSQYDGFRVREFQLANFSLLNSKLLKALKPTLNGQSYSNSLIIQSVYETNDPDCTLGEQPNIHKKIQERLIRNFNICGHIPDTVAELWWGLSSSLFKSEGCVIPSAILENYYTRFPHEFINKKCKYSVNTVYKQLRG
ncbi:hypothetical protein [Vibrio penaeicida]|uniref:hypothetical protein n=1 Tax=Vibrio penaeicida TaxID=104609 RepID=UPI000CEA084C|nr:hypothetical protein [Vibrio penaeicida]